MKPLVVGFLGELPETLIGRIDFGSDLQRKPDRFLDAKDDEIDGYCEKDPGVCGQEAAHVTHENSS